MRATPAFDPRDMPVAHACHAEHMWPRDTDSLSLDLARCSYTKQRSQLLIGITKCRHSSKQHKAFSAVLHTRPGISQAENERGYANRPASCLGRRIRDKASHKPNCMQSRITRVRTHNTNKGVFTWSAGGQTSSHFDAITQSQAASMHTHIQAFPLMLLSSEVLGLGCSLGS